MNKNEYEYMPASGYLFLPFRLRDGQKDGTPVKFGDYCRVFEETGTWRSSDIDIQYMFRFLEEHIWHQGMTPEQEEQVCTKHYRRMPDEPYGPDQMLHLYQRGKGKYRRSDPRYYKPVRLLELRCFLFSTLVGIVAIRMQYEMTEPKEVSYCEYLLKKVASVGLAPEGQEPKETLLELAQRAVGMGDRAEFFYYTKPESSKANVITFLECDGLENAREDLFFLRNCYGPGFSYQEKPENEKRELYQAATDKYWGISPEAIACLMHKDGSDCKFITGRFFHNLNEEYLLMWVLVLHQKYALYQFQTEFTPALYQTLDKLENYHERLFRFESDFVYPCIAEVPEYRILYERMLNVMALEAMFQNVREPLKELSACRQQEIERQEKQRDENTNRVLLFLTLLAVFSAGADLEGVWDHILDAFGWRVPRALGMAGSMAVLVACIGIMIWMAFKTRKAKKGGSGK